MRLHYLNALFRLASMDPKETAALIDAAGGSAEFAKLIGIDGDPYFHQRISNWKRRGIPSTVVLQHYELFQGLSRRPRLPPSRSRVA